MRYFGFDLGDGESCVALYSDQHIAPIILPVHGRNSFITALARYDGHPVVGALASDNPQAEDLRVCFKRNFRTNSDFVNQTVAAFAKGVLTALQDHSVVRHIMETEDVSFIVGCPADWADSDRTRYASLLMDAGLSNVRIVPESRAAFLSASTAEEDETLRRALMDCALVIDLGSSTMDLAYVCDGREYAVSTMGVQLGGGMLDELLLERAIDALCAEEAELVREILREKSAWKSRMMLSARRLKEQFFTLGTGEELTRRETIFCEGRHVLNLTISAAIVEELCERPSPLLEGESFRSRMMNCLLMAQQMTAQRPPKVVLLTGGASRMTFFQQLCRETFPDSVLHVSATPEFDIARGLAYAGHVDEMVRRLKADAAAYVESDAVEQKVQSAMSALTEQLSAAMARQLTDSVLVPEYRKWRQGETATLGDMEDACQKRAESLLMSPEWSAALSEVVSPWLDNILMDVQRNLNRLCEQYGVDVQRLQIRQAMVTTSTLPMRDNLPMPEMPLMEVLLDIIVAMMAANLCGGGGIALIASGPVGLVIGAAIGLIAMFVSRPALDKLTRPLMRQMNIPKLLRKTANEQRLLSDSNQKKMAQTIRDALAEDEALQVGLCTQIGQCIDSAILRLTEEKGMAVV